jgi:hypothetical protein
MIVLTRLTSRYTHMRAPVPMDESQKGRVISMILSIKKQRAYDCHTLAKTVD